MSSSLVHKLKDGLQDTIVFLRMLEGFRLAAVCERRRKTLLEKLEDLLGDTRKETPPSFEPKDSGSEAEEEEAGHSPQRRKESKHVKQEVTGIEERSGSVKEEPAPPKIETTSKNQAPQEKEGEREEVAQEEEEGDEEEEEEKKRSYSLHSFGSNIKKKLFGRSASPNPAAVGIKEEPSLPSHEDDPSIKLSGQVDRRSKARFGSSSWVKCVLVLREGCLSIDKEKQVDLQGCAAVPTLHQCELELHQAKSSKSFTFRTDSEEARNNWVRALQEAIQECTPPEEEGEEEDGEAGEGTKGGGKGAPDTPGAVSESNGSMTLPKIQVEAETGAKGKKKKEKELKHPMPGQEDVDLNAFFYRKGFRKWERRWCVLTKSSMLYMAQPDNTSEWVLKMSVEKCKVEVRNKGHEKNMESLAIICGKKTEQLSSELPTEMTQWKAVLESKAAAHNYADVLELASEDEELYEELDTAPPIPSSPRPAHTSFSPPQEEDDFAIDEDIYEEFDEPLEQPKAITQPSLPPRNQQTEPAPSLPPRNVGKQSEPLPSLPPRNPTKQPPSFQQPSSQAVQEEDDEVYDDVAAPPGAPEVDEVYDDVMMADQEPAMYTVPQDQQEEFYEDMAQPEEYVEQRKAVEPVTDDLYVDVDTPQPVTIIPAGRAPSATQPAKPTPSATQPAKPTPSPSSSAQRPAKPTSSSAQQNTRSGSVGSVTARNTPTRRSNKVAALSQMFGGGGSGGSATKTGLLPHKSPGVKRFRGDWCELEEETLMVYRLQGDKTPCDRLVLSECELVELSSDPDAGKFAFQLLSKRKAHQFSAKSKAELDSWLGAIRPLVKGVAEVYVANKDHQAGGEEGISFKKGTLVRVTSKNNTKTWTGQVENESHVFEGKVGTFPCSVVDSLEDLYI